MLIINKEHVGHIAQKIKASGINRESIDDVKKCWISRMCSSGVPIPAHAAVSTCAVSHCPLKAKSIYLKISALENNDETGAVRLLEQYGSMLEQEGISSGGGTCPSPG
jgi:hypothetical protein